jgi:hypothetical protein
MNKLRLILIISLVAGIVLYCSCNTKEDFTLNNQNYTNIVQKKRQNNIENFHNDNETYEVESVNDGDPNDVIVLENMPENARNLIKEKYNTRNHNNSKKYKVSNYANGVRGGNQEAVMRYVNDSNDLMDPTDIGSGDNENYTGMDDLGNDQYAPYRPEGSKKDKYKTSEIFNSKYYLPSQQSVNNDWFEVIPEAISVKNRHLINVSKPIGINTIGTSLRNASWDIRGAPQNPKFVISPWLQSTIEPDTNIKSLC